MYMKKYSTDFLTDQYAYWNKDYKWLFKRMAYACLD